MNERSINPEGIDQFRSHPIPIVPQEFLEDCPTGADYDWAWENLELRPLYEGKFIAVWQRTVWGSGKTAAAAWEDARRKPGCPSVSDLAFVPIFGMPGPKKMGGDKQP
jgi:hypothetical protein